MKLVTAAFLAFAPLVFTPLTFGTSAFVRLVFALLVFAPLAPLAAHAADEGPPCSDQVSTMDIVACVDKDTRLWDRRLNAAYKALGSFVDPDQREPLRVAQRLWVQYRDANASFYAAGEGTIHRIRAAECLWRMTRDRALELEQAARP